AFGGPVFLRRMSDGSSRSLATPVGMRVDRIAWFHDGARLLVSGAVDVNDAVDDAHPGLWILDSSGGKPHQIIAAGVNGIPSPDRAQIAWTSPDKSIIWVSAADGSGARQIRSGGETSAFTSLMWSPDSKRVAYQHRDYMPALDRRSNAILEGLYRYAYESVRVE